MYLPVLHLKNVLNSPRWRIDLHVITDSPHAFDASFSRHFILRSIYIMYEYSRTSS
jgi:hypothetical protein